MNAVCTTTLAKIMRIMTVDMARQDCHVYRGRCTCPNFTGVEAAYRAYPGQSSGTCAAPSQQPAGKTLKRDYCLQALYLFLSGFCARMSSKNAGPSSECKL